ncbi:hypothetical protein PV702_19770 [Streptomyces sp. FL06-04B]|uniref:hypothetical protein n=1 Tax=Streptomyces sp. FL06-04B TaxID=3028657 RepID=UPI0029B97FD7|nr:hypothetical protein [Streptomyces sp. FL06-04B]MDX3608640.1 hypothetical protein [Streptomyces sp. FL06-04B]
MRRGTRYEALLGPLLAGGAPPDLVTRAARRLGLPERGRYAVVVLGAPVPDAAVAEQRLVPRSTPHPPLRPRSGRS